MQVCGGKRPFERKIKWIVYYLKKQWMQAGYKESPYMYICYKSDAIYVLKSDAAIGV